MLKQHGRGKTASSTNGFENTGSQHELTQKQIQWYFMKTEIYRAK